MPKTILVADDSVTIRRVVELAFHDSEIRVESVGSGQEALARMEQARPDLILADVVMPAPDGYELCKSVKESGRPIPVLLLAGSFEPFDAERAQICGADGHLRKPFESRVLMQRVRELMERAVEAALPAPAKAPDPVSVDDVFNDLAALSEPLASARIDARPREPGPHGNDPWDLLLGKEESLAEQALAVPARPSAEAHANPALPPSSEWVQPAPEDIDALARAVVAHLSDRVIREIAWEVVPDLAEKLVRQRIRELESSDPDRAT